MRQLPLAIAALLLSVQLASAQPRDRQGNALPDGAVVRIGTPKLRAPYGLASPTFAPAFPEDAAVDALRAITREDAHHPLVQEAKNSLERRVAMGN